MTTLLIIGFGALFFRAMYCLFQTRKEFNKYESEHPRDWNFSKSPISTKDFNQIMRNIKNH